MEITSISIEYGELRSTGYPNFSNKKYGISVSATLKPGESAKKAKELLTDRAIKEVKAFFGDPDPSEEIPF